MRLKFIVLPLAIGFVYMSCSVFKKSSKKAVTAEQPRQTLVVNGDTSKNIVNQLKPYKDVITSKAISGNGLFKVHKLGGKYYFEISDSLLQKDLLIVSRISKAAMGGGYGGDQIGENIVQFSKAPNNKLFLKRVYYLMRPTDSSDNGMLHSIANSNFQPIVASFDVKALSPDSAGVVIDITDYLNNDNDVLFFDQGIKKSMKLGPLQPDKSYIDNIGIYPQNIEIKTVKTYAAEGQFMSYELNSSIVLLPKIPATPRLADRRVGYFSRGYYQFDGSKPVKISSMITRWRLEPKPADIEKYKRGELVEPLSPIVYYIDPATPAKWIPYLIEGVNDWQRAFEQAGFKNAIYALEAPKNDSTFSLEDARHNAIIYKASDIPNASGPQVSDPRTGEIIETHINWYHNVQQLLHDWYMIQAGATDSRARKMQFDDNLMGQLIRYVCAHEVGHTLGLMHNFGASSTIPVDSLRSKTYVAINGHTPSIMDYSRFNYVAQPEDKIDVNDLIPRIGIYDDWAIEWGYRWLPQFKNEEEEKAYMNTRIIEKLNSDKRYWFGDYGTGPQSLSEDLGDDPIKASEYGIENLKRIMPNLKSWTKTPNADYSALKLLNASLIYQFRLYISHVTFNIAGIQWRYKNVEQAGPVVNFMSKERQKAAVKFLNDELFKTPEWLHSKEVFSLVGGGGEAEIFRLQESVLNYLVFPFTVSAFYHIQTNAPKNKVYSFNDLMTDLEDGIFSELKTNENIGESRRNLQKIYISVLIDFLRKNKAGTLGNLDACTQIEWHLQSLLEKVEKTLPKYMDRLVRMHLSDLKIRIQQYLDNRQRNFPESGRTVTQNQSSSLSDLQFLDPDKSSINRCMSSMKSCWEELCPLDNLINHQ